MLFSSASLFVTATNAAGIQDFASYYKTDIADTFITLAVFPLMYLYFKSLTHVGKFGWKDYLWFLPVVVIGVATCLFYSMMDADSRYEFFRTIHAGGNVREAFSDTDSKMLYVISYVVFNFVVLIQSICVGIYALVNIIRYKNRLSDFYSTLDDKSIDRAFAVLVWFFVAISLAVLFVAIGGRPFLVGHREIGIFLFIVWTIVYFGLCYQGSRIGYSVAELERDLEIADSEAARLNYDLPEVGASDGANGASREKYSKYLVLFGKLIDQDKIYLQNTLRMDELARMMHTNRTYISRMINEEFGCTFSEYINRKRVEHAKVLMLSDRRMKQEELAAESGFLGASSFNRTFRRIAGLPPKEWLRKNV